MQLELPHHLQELPLAAAEAALSLVAGHFQEVEIPRCFLASSFEAFERLVVQRSPLRDALVQFRSTTVQEIQHGLELVHDLLFLQFPDFLHRPDPHLLLVGHAVLQELKLVLHDVRLVRGPLLVQDRALLLLRHDFDRVFHLHGSEDNV